MLSETGSHHLHVIAEEVSRVAVLCIGQDMGKWYGEIYRVPPKEGGALARQSKDTAMWVHLCRYIGALWIVVRLSLWLHGDLAALTVINGLRSSPSKTFWKISFCQKSLVSQKAARSLNARIVGTRPCTSERIWRICPDDWVQASVCKGIDKEKSCVLRFFNPLVLSPEIIR